MKKYVVYALVDYYDQNGYLNYQSVCCGVFEDMDSASYLSHELESMGYKTDIRLE